MAFVLPTFNLAVNIWRHGNPTTNPADVTAMGNLALGRRAGLDVPIQFYGSTPRGLMWLLLPKSTDVRDGKAATGEDTVEVPATSKRYYTVKWVDDIGAGFQNEHRFAMIDANSGWPQPFPNGSGPYPPPPGGLAIEIGNNVGTWGTTFNNVNYSTTVGGSCFVVILSDPAAPVPNFGGAPPISGLTAILPGPNQIRFSVFSITVGSGTSFVPITFPGGPPTVACGYTMWVATGGTSTRQVDVFTNGISTPTQTPSGYTPPPPFPVSCLAVAMYNDTYPAGTGPWNSPYLPVGGRLFSLLGSTFSVAVGGFAPSSAVFPTWTYPITTGRDYEAMTLFEY